MVTNVQEVDDFFLQLTEGICAAWSSKCANQDKVRLVWNFLSSALNSDPSLRIVNRKTVLSYARSSQFRSSGLKIEAGL